MTETPEPHERRHTQDPAEGEDTDLEASPEAARSHTEEPSEGAEANGVPDGAADEQAGGGEPGRKP
jgi:hypothetical protein